jgi:arginine-tRNA-protein transferase
MDSLFRYVAAPTTCGYLPDRQWSLEYEYVTSMTAAEYLERMIEGWRHFGPMLFRPACAGCKACQSLRVPVNRFTLNRSQKRNAKLNQDVVELRIGPPSVNQTKLALYDRYHAFQAEKKGWPDHPAKDAASYNSSFVENPFPPLGAPSLPGSVEEWTYYIDRQLVGVGYVDYLPAVPDLGARRRSDGRVPLELSGSGEPLGGGLSAIYFFYEPAERQRGLGVWNVLSLIRMAAQRGLPYVYLGYYVDGCASMAYKPTFLPNQIRGEDGIWRDFRS